MADVDVCPQRPRYLQVSCWRRARVFVFAWNFLEHGDRKLQNQVSGSVSPSNLDRSRDPLHASDGDIHFAFMKRVLYLCIGNACRSPMAEGFANHYGKGWLTAYSAGFKPAGIIMPNTIEAMRERGIDVAHQGSKGISEINLILMHWIVILDESLVNSVPADSLDAEVLHWFVPDPFGEPIDTYRRVRDEIETRVLQFIDIARQES
jgi:arsenate reductase